MVAFAVLTSVCPPAAISSISHYPSVQYACCFCVLVSQSCWLVYLSVVYTHILAYCVNVTYRKPCFVPLGSYWRICSFLGAGKSMSTPQDLFRSSGKVFLMQAWHHIAPSPLQAQCERNAWVLRARVWIKHKLCGSGILKSGSRDPLTCRFEL